MTITKNQRGSIDLILILVVFLAALALGGYVYYQQQQAKKAYDSAGSGPNVKKQAKKPAQKPGVQAETDMLVISEMGIEGKKTSGVTLQYSVKTVEGSKVAYFTSAELLKLEAGCTTDFGPGGTISQYAAGATYGDGKIDSNPGAKKIGNYYYIFSQETTVQKAVKNVLATLQVKP
jgi:hypothetical protein